MTRFLLCALLVAAAMTAWMPTAHATSPEPLTTADIAAPDSGDQFTAADVFKRLPLDVLDIIPKDTRTEMVIYAEAASDRKLLNALDGESYITRLTPDFAEVRLSPSSTLQIRILPLRKGKKIAMTIYTVGNEAQASDSDVRFFDEELSPLRADRYLKEPDLADFFSIPKGSLTTMKELRGLISFPTYLFTADSSSDNLTCTLTATAYLGEDDRRIVELFLAPPPVYTWDGSRFRLQKR